MDTPGIRGIGNAVDQPQSRHATDQLDGGVMPYQEKARDIADGCRPRADESFDPEQRLMLLRCQSLASRRRFAEGQEDPYLIAKLRKSFVIGITHHFAAYADLRKRPTRRLLRPDHSVLLA
jgi:hypothetical protein